MCILFIYLNNNGEIIPGEFRLILASNRDEYYTRPAKQAGPWDECPNVFGGRDMEPGREGGTWLAIGDQQDTIKCGALLNVTGENKPNITSGRGPIVANYLNSSSSSKEYAQQLLAKDLYGAYNFVSIELAKNGGASVLHTSNAPPRIDECDLGCALGFGNSPLESPLEKVKHGRKRFADIVDKHLKMTAKKDLVVDLLGLLSSDEKYLPDKELSRRAPTCAEKLASINVYFPESGYGSRTRTIILVDHNNQMEFIEETMASADPDGDWKRTEIRRQF